MEKRQVNLEFNGVGGAIVFVLLTASVIYSSVKLVQLIVKK